MEMQGLVETPQWIFQSGILQWSLRLNGKG